ncbi:hypothetical protein D3C80_1154550 [compost metagenome]
MVDDPALEGEEVGPFGRGAVQRPAGGGQGQLAVGEGGAGLDPGRAGGRGDHVLHGLAVARIQRGGAVAHRQVEGQVEVLGHAHLVTADVEVGGDAQGQGLARLNRGGDLDRHGQEDGVRIAVVHQALQPLTFRQGPQDVAGDDAVRQAPTERRRTAGIPLVAPVGVPAGPDLLAHGDDRRRTGRGPGAHGNQFSLDPLGALRPGGDRGGARLQRLIQGGRLCGRRRSGEGQPDEEGGEQAQERIPGGRKQGSDLSRREPSQPPPRDGRSRDPLTQPRGNLSGGAWPQSEPRCGGAGDH